MLVRLHDFVHRYLFYERRIYFEYCTYILHVAEPPRITGHPQDMRDGVPGEPVMFTAEATGTEPLNYQWEWKPAHEESRWQPCDIERFRGADSSTLTIPSQQKSNEGSYRCVISNSAGSQTSNSAEFSVGKNPIIRARMCSELKV